jgi:glucose uptake protein GlcU
MIKCPETSVVGQFEIKNYNSISIFSTSKTMPTVTAFKLRTTGITGG